MRFEGVENQLTLWCYIYVGALLSVRFPQTAEELLARVEAFLLNNNLDVLSLDQMGKFEQSLLHDHQKVRPSSLINSLPTLPRPAQRL